MSARDDATRATHAVRPPRSWLGLAVGILTGAVLGAVVTGVLAERFAPDRQPRYEVRVAWQGGPPTPDEWPRRARPGEEAVCVGSADRPLLAVRSTRRADAATLASELQRRRLSGVDPVSARRAAVRAQWRAGRWPEPRPTLTPVARCAALVRARLLQVMLLDTAVAPARPPSSAVCAAAQARLDAAGDDAMRLALATRPDSLAAALTTCARLEADWLRSVAAEPAGGTRAGLEAVWRWRERLRAAVLDSVERRIEARLPEAQRVLVPPAAFELALELERLAPDPAAILFVDGRWQAMPAPSRIPRTWARLLGGGALAGALAGLGLAWLVQRVRRRGHPRPSRLVRGVPAALSVYAADGGLLPAARDPQRAWQSQLAWLHVVSGPDRGRIVHAVLTLAAGFVARGERVLALDAGRELRLHESLGGEARWGLGECLAGEVPLLGAVQAAGARGFFFLAHGEHVAAERWEGMSQLLEDARQRFDRVILALEHRAPRAAALPLGGRVLEAWWAEPGPGLSARAAALSERLGIPFGCMDLNWLTQVAHEATTAPTEQRPSSAATGQDAVGMEMAEAAAARPADAESCSPPAEAPAAPPPDTGPAVLGCDPDTTDRLRFLMWMRRVRAERRPADADAEVGVGN